jgi:hypothetical protein
MKKAFLFLMLLLAVPVAILAQDIQPPTSWSDILINPGKWFVDFGAISLLTAFVAAFFNGLMKVEKKFLKQLVAWAVAIILLVVSDLLNFGYAKEFPILLAVIHGFAAGLASNGWFDIPTLKAVLDTIEGWFKPSTPTLR